MSEKIYTRLLRFYPARFRKEYESEALQLIRDRLRDERGFFKRARLWWDLVADVLTGLPPAYRNSYAVTEAASLSLHAAGIPSFKSLDEEPLGRGSILVGGTISLILLAAFALLLSRQIAFRPLSSSNGRLSPIEAVMQRVNQPPAPDSPASGPPDAAAPAPSQMSAPQVQPTSPGASIPNTPASSSESAIPNGEQNQVLSPQVQKSDKQTIFTPNGQQFANRLTTDARKSSPASQSVADRAQAPISPGQPHPAAASRAMVSITPTRDIADTWQGTLHAGQDLRAVIKIAKANSGGYKAAFYSIDQSDTPFPVTNLTLEGNTVKYSIKAFDLSYEGKLSADGKMIVGRSSQGTTSLPLTFTRSTPETAWKLPQPLPGIP
jgi:hypothetical protein